MPTKQPGPYRDNCNSATAEKSRESGIVFLSSQQNDEVEVIMRNTHLPFYSYLKAIIIILTW